MGSAKNDTGGNEADLCTPLIDENQENENIRYPNIGQKMDPHQSGYGYNQQPNIGGYDARNEERGSSFDNNYYRRDVDGGHVVPMEEYTSDQVLDFNYIPEGRTSQPQTLIVRNRKKSYLIENLFDQLDQFDEFDDEDNEYLKRTKSMKRDRSKSLKERKLGRQASHKELSFKARKTLAERYNEMKDRDEVNPKNLATLLRWDRRQWDKRQDSTVRKVNSLRYANDSKTWKNMKRSYNEFAMRISLWYTTFKKIEGKYGTAVMTYFRFLKWLLKLNMYTMLITFCVITVPYLTLGPYTYKESVRNMSLSETSINCTSDYIKYMENFTSQESVDEKVIDFLQGTGWMERTILFYGVYYNKTYYNQIEKKHFTYNMSLAYLLAVGTSFLVGFLLVVKNSAKNFKVTLGKQSSVASYTNKVFAAWDYCIKNQKAAKVKSVGIKFEITADLKEENRIASWQQKDLRGRCNIYFKRIVINLLVMILLGGSLTLIAYTTQKMIELQKNEYEEILILIIQYVPYITITILNLGIPIIFQKLVQFEMYRYETELKFTLARSVLLRLSSPIVLLAILYDQLIYTSGGTAEGKCGNNKWSGAGSGLRLRGDVKCWETYVGQQLYKLVLIDAIVECGIILFCNIPRSLLYKHFKDKVKWIKMIGPQEFDLTQSVVDIVYSQNICWLGMMFSPLIPFMTFVKIIIFFYAKILLLQHCEAQERPYRTSRSNSLFMTVLLLSFLFAAIPIGYMVGNLQPSQSCGPFRLYEDTNHVIFDTISYNVATWPMVLRDVFKFIGTIAFFVPVLVLLCILMYYYWLLGQGYKKTEKILKHQLKMEGHDKRYLMNRVMEFLESTEVNQNTVPMHSAAF